jgi:PTH1 family peptidyl-tRNA hydrolase
MSFLWRKYIGKTIPHTITANNTETHMKYLIVGLGNIGNEYKNTRHNIGFTVVEALASSADAEWRDVTHGEMATVKHKGRTFLLLKPNTYMNLSGKAVRYWLQKEKLEKSQMMVICDDLNLPSGSAGGQNGLKNIQELLVSMEYPRLRVGIGDDFSKGKQVQYVLGKWTEAERAELSNIMDRCIESIRLYGSVDIQAAMNVCNK